MSFGGLLTAVLRRKGWVGLGWVGCLGQSRFGFEIVARPQPRVFFCIQLQLWAVMLSLACQVYLLNLYTNTNICVIFTLSTL